MDRVRVGRGPGHAGVAPLYQGARLPSGREERFLAKEAGDMTHGDRVPEYRAVGAVLRFTPHHVQQKKKNTAHFGNKQSAL